MVVRRDSSETASLFRSRSPALIAVAWNSSASAAAETISRGSRCNVCTSGPRPEQDAALRTGFRRIDV